MELQDGQRLLRAGRPIYIEGLFVHIVAVLGKRRETSLEYSVEGLAELVQIPGAARAWSGNERGKVVMVHAEEDLRKRKGCGLRADRRKEPVTGSDLTQCDPK